MIGTLLVNKVEALGSLIMVRNEAYIDTLESYPFSITVNPHLDLANSPYNTNYQIATLVELPCRKSHGEKSEVYVPEITL